MSDEDSRVTRGNENSALVRDAMIKWTLRDLQAEYGLGTAIKMRDNVEIDEYGTVTLGAWGGWLVQVMPMLFNDRLVLTPICRPNVYDYGWCFDKGGAAYLAAYVWDPDTQGEPDGFKKRIGVNARRPGETGCCG